MSEEARSELKRKLSDKTKHGLVTICKEKGITGYSGKNKEALLAFVIEELLQVKPTPETIAPEPVGPEPKIVDAESAEPEPVVKPKKTIKYWVELFAGLASILAFILAATLALSPEAREKVRSFFPTDDGKPFEEIEGYYNILILPFAPLKDCTIEDTHFEEAVKRRLLQVAEDDGLNLQVKFYKGKHCPTTFEEGRERGKKFNADLVVWGDYAEYCGNETEVCVKFAVVNKITGISEQGESDTQPLKLSEIQHGKLQGDIDNVMYWSLGMRAYEIKDYTKAVIYWERMKDEKNASLSFGLAFCYQEFKDFETAIEYYTETIRLNPQHVNAFYNRGIACRALKKYDLAIVDYTEAIRLNPQDATAFNNRGNTYGDLKKYDLAIADYTEAIRLNPQYATAFYHRGITYSTQNKYDLAINDYTEAIRLNPQYANAFNNRGITYRALKKYDLAIVDYTEAIRLNPQDAIAFHNRGATYNDLKKYDLAIADFTELIRLNPQDATAFGTRGITYKALKRYDLAIADLEAFIRLAGPEWKEDLPAIKQEIERLRKLTLGN